MKKYTISIEILLLIIGILNVINLGSAILKSGEDFRPFALQTIEGKIFEITMESGQLTLKQKDVSGNLLSISRPKVILVDFWATWCLPCRAAMPHLEKLYTQFLAEEKNKGRLEFFGIALDRQGAALVKPFLQKIKLSYPQLCNPVSSPEEGLIRSPQEMASVYKVQEIPVVYLINREGKIVYAHVGFKEEYIKEIEKVISSLLGEVNE